MLELDSWITTLPALLWTLLCIILPGGFIASALGAKGWNWLAVSIAGSFSAIAATTVIAPLLKVEWSAIPVFIVAISIALLIFIARKLLFSKFPKSIEETWSNFPSELALLALPVLAIGAVFCAAIPSPNLISQTYDAIFHLNAVQWIIDTGSASPFSMNIGNPDANAGFYPSTWHALVSLTIPLTSSVAVSTNIAALVVSAFVWPVSIIFLMKLTVGLENIAHRVFAFILAAAFPAMPLLLTYFGVLYPNLLAYALLPIPLALLINILGFGAKQTLEPLGRVIGLLGALVGVGLAHPNAIFSIIAIALPVYLLRQWDNFKKIEGVRKLSRKLVIVLSTAIVAALCALLWMFGNLSAHWQTYQNLPSGIIEFLFLGGRELPHLYFVAVLVLVGICVIIFQRQRKNYWLLASYAVLFTLFIFATALDLGKIRSAFVGIWYGDPYRIFSLIPIIAAPIALKGIKYLLSLKPLARFKKGRALGVALLVLIATQVHPFWLSMKPLIESRYTLDSQSLVVSDDEYRMFEFIKVEIPVNENILGSPWNGSSLVYAFTGNDPFSYIPRASISKDVQVVLDGLATAQQEACEISESRDLRYILDFGDEDIIRDPNLAGLDAATAPFKGIVNIEENEAVSLVKQFGKAKLYKVVGCM